MLSSRFRMHCSRFLIPSVSQPDVQIGEGLNCSGYRVLEGDGMWLQLCPIVDHKCYAVLQLRRPFELYLTQYHHRDLVPAGLRLRERSRTELRCED